MSAVLVRQTAPMSRRDRIVLWAYVAAFLSLAAAMITFLPWGRSLDWGTLVVVLIVTAVATRVSFVTESGYTNPSELAMIPALFLLPPPVVPLVIAGASTLGILASVALGKSRPDRLVVGVAYYAWFVVGPAIVLSLAGAPSPLEASVWVLALALASQFVGDLIASWPRDRFMQSASLRQLLADSYWVYGIDLAFAPVGFLVAIAVVPAPWALWLLIPLLVVMHYFSQERQRRMEQMDELNAAYRGTAMVLGDVVESDDAYTGEHSRGVVQLALEVALELGLDEQTRRRVDFGAMLHDVGKVAIPKEIINKPGPLDPEEWDIVKTHTTEGQRMLDQVGGLMRNIGLIVRAHHERWDGKGYPDGLQGTEIPIEARIVSACDTWSAMTTTRSYRIAMSREAAMAELRSASGTQLDPDVVDALIRVIVRNGDHKALSG
jgi:putative nucleotidyltransferase with HDIG domain